MYPVEIPGFYFIMKERKLQKLMDRIRELEIRITEEKKEVLSEYLDLASSYKNREFVAGYWPGANTYRITDVEISLDEKFNTCLDIRYSKVRKNGTVSKVVFFRRFTFYFYYSASYHIRTVEEFLLKPNI